jgi:hypothetical protein
MKDGKGGASSMHGRGEKSIKPLNGKPQHVIPLGRPGGRWKQNVKYDLKEPGGRVRIEFVLQ